MRGCGRAAFGLASGASRARGADGGTSDASDSESAPEACPAGFDSSSASPGLAVDASAAVFDPFFRFFVFLPFNGAGGAGTGVRGADSNAPGTETG